mgnify:CR=1 FL=1
MSGFQRAHITVEGRVQGVGFRYFTLQVAQATGLTGWVRNLADGRVEIEAQGENSALENMICRLREGPVWSLVSNVKVRYIPAVNDSSFEVK